MAVPPTLWKLVPGPPWWSAPNRRVRRGPTIAPADEHAADARAENVSARRGRSRAALLVVAALAAVSVGIILRATNALRTQELQTIDTRFEVRGAKGAPSNLLIVAIDDETFTHFTQQHLHSQWPFPRRYHATVINTLHRDGARLIGVDIQFTEPTDPLDDNALINAVARAPGTVLATTAVSSNGHTDVFGGDSVLRAIRARAGDAAVTGDAGGTIRQLPLAVSGLDTFGYALAREARPGLGAPPQTPTWIDYLGPPGTVRAVSYWQVYDNEIPPSEIRGRIVIIGPTASTLQDLHSTPTSGGGFMSGAEIQANAASTFLRGGPLRSTPLTVDLLLIALLGSIAPVLAYAANGRRLLVRGAPLGAAVAYVTASQLTFDSGWIVPVVTPLTALAVGYVATLGVDYLAASFERERVYDLFSRFVPDAVVKEVVAQADGARLGGVLRQCTVMFTDLRGFTSFSSSQEPEVVIDVVNSYLGEMSDAILSAGGTLVAYMGDGIFAVFGAPIELPDHADRALAAAREMIEERLPRFNSQLGAMGVKADFRMGIGLNSGPVISGNVGSERRLEYAAIGDTTNLAARVEAATKDTPNMLLFTESTRDSLTRPPPDMFFVTELRLRGAGRPIRLWTIAGTEGERNESTQASVLPAPASHQLLEP